MSSSSPERLIHQHASRIDRVPVRSSSQIIGHPSRPLPRQLSLDLNVQWAQSRRDGAALKRQRRHSDLEELAGGAKEIARIENEANDVRLSVDGPKVSVENVDQHHDIRDTKDSLSAFPPSPGAGRRERDYFPNQRSSIVKSREDVLAKPYVLDTPKAAPAYSGNSPSDFFPWTGKHQEDELSEQSIKSGYYDKTFTLQSELNSARLSLWPSVKHKSGVQILSALYVSVLSLRQDQASVTPKSTFKPPPRATLTEAKRESWLNDLADPDVPLRRLSRTIPHGIRGRVLLDQSLTKLIPPWRTVWLVKCVGANEIRAFKRKGTAGAFASGGEAKWIRDWTICVEQFLEHVIRAPLAPEWQQQMLYSLHLAMSLFAEHLMDKEHFLSWAVSSFRTASTKDLPPWLVLVNSCWSEMLQFWRIGQELAMALVEQLLQLSSIGLEDTTHSLWQQLLTSIRLLILQRPICLLCPYRWNEHEPILWRCIDGTSAKLAASFQSIKQRNARFLGHRASIDSSDLLCQKILKVLDISNLSPPLVSRECLAVTQDPTILVSTAIKWAATRYRSGLSRVYLATRLIRWWCEPHVDLEGRVLSAVQDYSAEDRFDNMMIYKVVGELIRSRHLSVPKLLQRILARGSSQNAAKTDNSSQLDSIVVQERNFFAKMLCSIPLHELPDHTANLRKLLLGQYGWVDRYGPEDFIVAQNAMSSEIDFLRRTNAPVSQISAISAMEALRRCDLPARFELLHWIRLSLMTHVSGLVYNPQDVPDTSVSSPSLTYSDFTRLFPILEESEDFTLVADVLCTFAKYGENTLLADISEAVNVHFSILHAIGAAKDVYEILLDRMKEVTSRSEAEKRLLYDLIKLTKMFPGRRRTLCILEKELRQCEPKSASTACSPMSDILDEVSLGPNSSFVEEIESLFNGATSIDRPLFCRLFEETIDRFKQCLDATSSSADNFVEILAKLRQFDQIYFQELITTWLESVCLGELVLDLQAILPLFLCRGVVQLSPFLEQICLDRKKVERLTGNALLGLLAILCKRFDHDSIYKFHDCYIAIDYTVASQPDLVAKTIRHAIDRLSTMHSVNVDQLRIILFTDSFLNILKIIARSSTALANLHDSSQPLPGRMLTNKIIGHCVGLDASQDTRDVTILTEMTLRRLDHFSVRFCSLILRLRSSQFIEASGGGGGGSQLETLARSFINEAIQSTHFQDAVLKHLLTTLPRELAVKIYSFAIRCLGLSRPDAEFLHLLQNQNSDGLDKQSRLLDIAFAVEECLLPDDVGSTMSITAETCVRFQNLLSRRDEAVIEVKPSGTSRSDPNESLNPAGQKWLVIILRLLTLHQRALQRGTKISASVLTCLSIALGSILTDPFIEENDHFYVQIHDALALISLSLDDQSRLHCLNMLQGQLTKDAAPIYFLLGPREDEGFLNLAVEKDWTGENTKPSTTTNHEQRESRLHPFCLRRWELVQDTTPSANENDASLSLALFGARRMLR